MAMVNYLLYDIHVYIFLFLPSFFLPLYAYHLYFSPGASTPTTDYSSLPTTTPTPRYCLPPPMGGFTTERGYPWVLLNMWAVLRTGGTSYRNGVITYQLLIISIIITRRLGRSPTCIKYKKKVYAGRGGHPPTIHSKCTCWV